jgi:dihydropteroate synthase
MQMIRCGRYTLALDKPLVMGIVNITPDSFSGDGRDARAGIEHARRQLEAGADILDLGAESSRPGSAPVTLGDEIARLRPVLEEVSTWGVPISVDTYKPEVMRLAIETGAAIINDIAALRQPGALQVVSDSDCAVCLMHMQGEPRNMQANPQYNDVISEVAAFLAERVAACEMAGVARERLMLDPGFGFGKTLEHNVRLFQSLAQFTQSDLPYLVGVSRKRMLGEITGREVADRQTASVAGALLAAQQGAKILRVHDVAATRDALLVWQALRPENH